MNHTCRSDGRIMKRIQDFAVKIYYEAFIWYTQKEIKHNISLDLTEID
jgi:hypothetical protein